MCSIMYLPVSYEPACIHHGKLSVQDTHCLTKWWYWVNQQENTILYIYFTGNQINGIFCVGIIDTYCYKYTVAAATTSAAAAAAASAVVVDDDDDDAFCLLLGK